MKFWNSITKSDSLKVGILLLYGISWSLVTHAQKLPEGILKMMEYYTQNQDFAYRCTNIHYPKKEDKTGEEYDVAFIYKNGDAFYHYSEDYEVIQNQKGTLTLYPRQKKAIYKSLDKSTVSKSKQTPWLSAILPNFTELIDSSTYDGVINGKKAYSLYPKYGAIYKIQVWLKSNYSIDKIVYYSRDTEYLGYKTELLYYPLSADKISIAQNKINQLNKAPNESEVMKAFKTFTFIEID